MKNKPLILIIERARAIFKSALNLVIKETSLPAYLIEGVMLELLAEVRSQKAGEIAAEYSKELDQTRPPEEELESN